MATRFTKWFRKEEKKGVELVNSVLDSVNAAISDLEAGAAHIWAEIGQKGEEIARIKKEADALSAKHAEATSLKSFLGSALGRKA